MLDLTQGLESKVILKFSLPFVLSSMIQQVYVIIDSIIVGQVLGENAVAAIGASIPAHFLLLSIMIGFSLGAATMIAIFKGANDGVKIRRTIDTAWITNLGIALFISLTGYLSTEYLLKAMLVPDNIFQDAAIFLKWTFLGVIPLTAFNLTTGIQRSLGDGKTPLIYLAISCLLNIVFVYIFVAVFSTGVKGSAWATFLAQFITAIAFQLHVNKKYPEYKVNLFQCKFNKNIFYHNLKLGLPTSFQQALVAGNMLVMTMLVNTYGSEATAAFTVVSRIESFLLMIVMNFSLGFSFFVGQNSGAKKYARVLQGLKFSLLVSVAFSLAFSLFIILFSKEIVLYFLKTPSLHVVEYAQQYLHIVPIFYIFCAIMFILNAIPRGVGASVTSFLITLTGIWLIRIPCAFLFSKYLNWGLAGVWWSIPAGWVIANIPAFAYYKSNKWQNTHLQKMTH